MSTHTAEAVLRYDDVVARFDPVLGLEVHVELATATLFGVIAWVFGPTAQTLVYCAAAALLVVAGSGDAARRPALPGMDPADARCDAFYRVLAESGTPLIVHCGEEKAVKGSDTQAFGNPLRLRPEHPREGYEAAWWDGYTPRSLSWALRPAQVSVWWSDAENKY